MIILVEEKDCKINRILDLYDRLMEGEFINKKEEAEYFNVNPKTIQRDIEDSRFMYAGEFMKIRFKLVLQRAIIVHK